MPLVADLSGNSPGLISCRGTVIVSQATIATFAAVVMPTPRNKFMIDSIVASSVGTQTVQIMSGSTVLIELNLVAGIPVIEASQPSRPIVSGLLGDTLNVALGAAQATDVTIGYTIV